MITGASRGMGVSFTNAALAAGDAVVATGRRPGEISRTFGDSERLLAVKLDVTSTDDAKSATDVAVERARSGDQPIWFADHDCHAGFYRTGLASPESLVWPDLEIADYAERSATQRAWWTAVDGTQPGDPDKLARAYLAPFSVPGSCFSVGRQRWPAPGGREREACGGQ